jgi:hypothetical protein
LVVHAECHGASAERRDKLDVARKASASDGAGEGIAHLSRRTRALSLVLTLHLVGTMTDTAFLDLREEIMAQHGRLRGLLETLETQAAEVIRPRGRAPADLAEALNAIVRALHEHMDFEEDGLARDPIARQAWGPANAEHLHEEHQRQRAELARIAREAALSGDRISQAFAIRGFISDVLLDMRIEEGRLSTSAAA